MIPTFAPPGVISGNANTPTPMPQAPGQTTLAPKPLSKKLFSPGLEIIVFIQGLRGLSAEIFIGHIESFYCPFGQVDGQIP